ncbi:MAG: transcriptional repressor [Chloroflexi bacterium]|nr:transcriptional repressor [Chloroflexota bacterium]
MVIMINKDRDAALIGERGKRSTKQRRAVLEFLSQTKTHPNAAAIYSEIRKKVPRISLGTVYRIVAGLRDEGAILELDYGPSSRYDGNISRHYHISCVSCGKVADMNSFSLPDLVGKVHHPEFEVVGHRLEFFGYCFDCRHARAED